MNIEGTQSQHCMFIYLFIFFWFFFLNVDPNQNIRDLDIAVNAVATALKDFFKRFPSILTQEQMDEMEQISSKCDSVIFVLFCF